MKKEGLAGGHPGIVYKLRPRAYKKTPQQVLFSEAATACGIEKGISREQLVEAMVHCLPEFYAKRKMTHGKKNGEEDT